MASAALISRYWNREFTHYPDRGTRYKQLLLIVLITVTLYYELYVVGGVAPIFLAQLHIPFLTFVYLLAFGALVGAFGSLFAGLSDRFGRANLIVYGSLLVGLITFFWVPNVKTAMSWGISYAVVSIVEGIVLVATPALIRDFSPQVGRATAMGFWTVGPVLGSLAVSSITTIALPIYQTWQSQFVISGIIGLVVFVLAFLFLRDLSPGLRDQLIVNERDRMLVELRAKGLDTEASLRNPWRQMLHLDIIGSAIGISVMLLFYLTMVAFGVLYLVMIFQFSTEQANAVLNWIWATNAVTVIVAGLISDHLRVRKPLMLVGGLGNIVTIYLYLQLVGQHPTYSTLVWIGCLQTMFAAIAYVSWMASFSETVEARNPALTATGLAIWGWAIRLVAVASFIAFPAVVKSVNPLIEAPYYLGAYKEALTTHMTPSADLLAHVGAIQIAAGALPGEWRTWFWICILGVVVFLATIFLVRGRWSPAAARADEEAHDIAVARELAALQQRR